MQAGEARRPVLPARPWLVFASLALLAFFAFLPALDCDFVVTSDDWDYVVQNPAVRAGFTLAGLRWALSPHAANWHYWHPLTWLSHMADVQLYGMNPAGHHLTNVLLHALNAALLGALLFDLTGRAGRSWLVAALFAVHPTRVESVAWVAERKDVLCTLFWILATWAYVRGTRASGRWRYAPALALFALGLASKPMIVTLPVLLLLLDAGPLGRLRSLRDDLPRLVLEKLPFVALAAAGSAVTLFAQASSGAVRSLDTFPFAVRLGNASLAYAAYLRTFAWPVGLSAYYVHPGTHLSWAAAGATTVALAIATLFALRSHRCYLETGWLWFLISLLPVIGIVQVGEQARADRYTYVPYIGLFVVLVWGLADLLDRLPRAAAVKAGLAILVVCAATAATRLELPHWRDARALFSRAVDLDPRNYFALQNRAVALLYSGELTTARRDLDRVLELRPGYPYALRAAAEAAAHQGDPAAAADYLERLLRVPPEDPVAVARLADLRMHEGNLEAALALFRRARRAAPGYTVPAYAYGIALVAHGEVAAAIEQLETAAAGSPARADWRAQAQGARQLAAGEDGPERRELERVLSAYHRRVAARLRQRGREAEARAQEAEAARLSR